MLHPLSPSGTILQDYVPDTQDADTDVVETPSSAFHYEAPSCCSFITTPTPHIPTSLLTTINLFSISIPLSFQRMLYKWNHKVCSQYFSVSKILWKFICATACINDYSFILLNSVPQYKYTTTCLTHHPLNEARQFSADMNICVQNSVNIIYFFL